MRLYNKNFQINRRKDLRNNQTKAEKFLWEKVRRKQLGGYKFRRQHGIGAYIVDFYCPDLKLVIEVDGGYHTDKDTKEYDKKRDEYITSLGIRVIRFTNEEVMENIEKVLREIKKKIQ